MYSLQDACFASLSHQTVSTIESIILSNTHPEYEGGLEAVETYVKPLAFILPLELLERLFSECDRISPYAGLLIALAVSSRTNSVVLESKQSEDVTITFPTRFLANSASHLSAGLTQLELPGVANFTDDFLRSLSTSAASSTLKTLLISQNNFSDASSAVWASLTALERVDLGVSNLMSHPSILALSDLPNLNHLSTFTGTRIDPENIRLYLAPGRMQQLKVFRITTSDDLRAIDILIEVLEKRTKNLDLIEGLMHFPEWLPPEKTRKLHRICPSFLSSEIDSIGSDSVFPGVKTLYLHSTAELRADVTSKLPTQFPSLEFLSLENVKINELSNFANLKKLVCASDTVNHLQALPKQLRYLRLTHTALGPPQGDPNMLDNFISMLLQFVPELEELDLNFNAIFHQHHVQHLLGGLVRLKKLKIVGRSTGYRNSESDEVLVSHPSLQSFPEVDGTNFILKPSHLPSMTTTPSISSSNWLTWTQTNKSSLPSLQRLHLSATPLPFLESPPASLQSLLVSFQSSHCLKLRYLSLSSDRHTLDPLLIVEYRNLVSLSLRVPGIPMLMTQRILAAMPWLVNLSMRLETTSELNLANEFRHPRLNRLELLLVDPKAAHSDSTVNLSFSDTLLPHLGCIHLSLLHQPANVNLLDCQSIHTLQIRGTRDSCVNISIHQVPSLASIDIADINLETFNLFSSSTLESLSWVYFRSVSVGDTFNDDSTLSSSISCPALMSSSFQIRAATSKRFFSVSVRVFPKTRNGLLISCIPYKKIYT